MDPPIYLCSAPASLRAAGSASCQHCKSALLSEARLTLTVRQFNSFRLWRNKIAG